MNQIRSVLVVGTADRIYEFREKPLPDQLKVTWADPFYLHLMSMEVEDADQYPELQDAPDESLNPGEISFYAFDLIIDLNLDEAPDHMIWYADLDNIPVVGCAVKMTLAEIVEESGMVHSCRLLGWNALPTFMHGPLQEMSCYDPADRPLAESVALALGWKWEIVDDRPGMVSPRIICMIINEACYTLQEGTASARDIDNAMKLGTAYPWGPFEWAERIGLPHVYDTLLALQREMNEEKYKICPLLRSYALKGRAFLA